MQGTVQALFVAPEKNVRPVSLNEVRAGDAGFEGDVHAKTAANRRQILMVSECVLREFDLPPGSLFENMIVEGLDVMRFEAGQQLRVGDTILEVTVPCEPCIQMDRIRHGLKRALNGKRGIFVRVVAGGTIRVGDTVNL